MRLICDHGFLCLFNELKRLRLILPEYNLDRHRILERIKEIEELILKEIVSNGSIMVKE